MANFPQSKKRARQAVVRRVHNASMHSAMRTQVKNMRHAVEASDAEQALASFNLAVPKIDKLASKGVLHRQTAARYKSRLARQLKKLAGK